MNKIRRMYSFGVLKNEIEGYGFHYSFQRYLISMCVMLLIILATSLIYCLKIPYLVFISTAGLLFVPLIIRAQFRYMYEQKRFDDVVVYLEQMAYSFQKQPKILTALKDTEKVTEGKLKELIHKAIVFLENQNSMDVYQDAFGIIEQEYNCSRIHALHNFMIQVEECGGNYTRYLNVLVMDFNRWTERTYLYQKDMNNIKRKSNIAIVMSFFIAAMSLFIKKYCDITNEFLYQSMSVGFILSCTLFYALVQFKFNVSWLNQYRSDKMVLKDYNKALYADVNAIRKKSIPVYLLFIVLAAGLYVLGKPVIAGLIFIFTFLLPFVPVLNKKNARKRTIAEIRNSFPEWLRDVALNLQFQTVQTAIEDSYEECPVVLKGAVKKMKEELAENPSAITPYYNFLREFNLLDITSNVKSLYSMTESNKEDMAENIAALINRNYTMMDKNEKISGENKVNTVSFLIYVPMILACLKLLIDMTIFISVFVQNMGSAQNNIIF